jgi:hypothetical protein
MTKRAITSSEFKKALLRLTPTEGQRRFLQAHYRATGRVSTMSRLAEAAGYKRYGGVNLQYGGLARRIARILGKPLPATKVALLVDFVGKEEISNRNWVIHMRPAFASALRSAEWVR